MNVGDLTLVHAQALNGQPEQDMEGNRRNLDGHVLVRSTLQI